MRRRGPQAAKRGACFASSCSLNMTTWLSSYSPMSAPHSARHAHDRAQPFPPPWTVEEVDACFIEALRTPCTMAVDIHRTGKTIALSEIEEAPEPSGIPGLRCIPRSREGGTPARLAYFGEGLGQVVDRARQYFCGGCGRNVTLLTTGLWLFVHQVAAMTARRFPPPWSVERWEEPSGSIAEGPPATCKGPGAPTALGTSGDDRG